MAGRRLTLNDLLNDDPPPSQPTRQHAAPGADCFPLSLQASSARRTPSPPRGRYDPLSDARVSASAGSSGGMSSHSRSPSVPFPGRYLTGPGYSPSMSLPRASTSHAPAPSQQHSPSPLGGLEALMEAASAEQRRMHDESTRRSSAAVAEFAVPHSNRKRKRPSDPVPPPPRVLAGPGMQPSELSEKEREVVELMAARAASRSPEHARSPVVPAVTRTPGPRRPWEDTPTPPPAAWRPHEPAAYVHAPETRRVELQPGEPVVLRRVDVSPNSRYTFKSPVATPKPLPPTSKPPSTSSKPSSTGSKPLSGPSRPLSALVQSSPPQPPTIIPPSPAPSVPKISPTTPQLPPVRSKTPSTPQASPPLPIIPPPTSKPPSVPSKPPSKPSPVTSKAASPPPRTPSPPASRDVSHSPELPSFAGPSWGARPSLAKLAPTKARPTKPVKRDRAQAGPTASISPVSATTALPPASPPAKSPVLPPPTPVPVAKQRSESVERMLEESAGLAPTPPPQPPVNVPTPAPREKEKEVAKKGKEKEVAKEKEKPISVPTPTPVAAPVSAPEPEPTPAPIPAPAPSPPPEAVQLKSEPAAEPAPSTPELPPPAPTPIQTTPAVPPAPTSAAPPNPVVASPALDADEELARSLDAQLNRRARPERERRRTEKLRDVQPDLEVLLAQAERERAAAPSKNRARDKKRAEEAARKKQEEGRAAGAKEKAKEDGDRGREKRRKVDDDDELDAELLSLVGDRPSPVPAKTRDVTTATASPPPPPLHTKAELDRESMPPPPSPDEDRAPSALVPQKRGPGRPPGAKNKNKLGTVPASAIPAKKKPAPKKSTPGARSRSSSVMPMPSSSLAHEVKFDSDDDEPQHERGVSMEVDRAPEPEDAIAQAWAQREERERAKKEEKERERAAREARKRETKERVAEKENRKDKGAGSDEDEDEEDDKLYCVCKMPYDEEKVMIACDRCDEWYHTSCVDMPDSEVDLVDQFICPPCVEKDPHLNLRTTYKRRCQRGLEDDGACNKPSRGALSKYCSDACGIAAVRSRIGAWNGDHAALWESVRGAERREGVVVRILDSTSLPNAGANAPTPNANGHHPPTVTVNGDGIVVLPSKPRAERTLARLRAQLDVVVAQRENLTRALESASWRKSLLELATARAEADSSTCGWDQRLCFGDAEIADFGADVFATYEKDAAKRAERAASEATDGEREGSDEDESDAKREKDAEKMDVDGEEEELEAPWWCYGRKKCDRHFGWQKLRQSDVEWDQETKMVALERLTTRERDIRRRVEDILDPHAAPPASAAQVEDDGGTPEPTLVNGHAHGGAARANGTEAVVKKSHKKKST
ncbi:unnamed protein product [Peniophora sp. CBMAI 1063]|nr:unnamed protein product [Peniophora sp. CBMAI 1063]